MKKLLLFPALILSFVMFGQNQPPVAVNDTVPYPVHLGDTITINVLQNDYDPDGDPFFIQNCPNADFISDSTVTFILSPTKGGNKGWQQLYYKNGYVYYTYFIWDSISNFYGFGYIVLYLDEPYYNYLDVNNIKARFNSFGHHFWDLGGGVGAEYFFPKDSLTSTLFASSLWIGGMDETGDLRLSAERYRQIGDDYWEGPLTDDGNADTDTANAFKWHKVWKLNVEDVQFHIDHWSDPGYEPIDAIATWPAHGDTTLGQSYYLAPFIDVNNDGNYKPIDGDYPLIRGDQCIFFIFNDKTDTSFRDSQGVPIGVEIHGFAYAFDTPGNPALNNTTFLSYKIFNRSQHTLTDAYIGTFMDIDLGYAWDDFVGCDVGRGAFFGYNGDDFDEKVFNSFDSTYYPAYEYNIPAQGIVILGGPYMDADGEDNPAGGCDESINGVGFGDGIADNERYGMSNFVAFSNWSGPTGDPVVDYEFYNYMKSIWKDSTALLYGGNGHVSSGAYGPAAKFMFPGLSDPCNWGTGGEPPYGAQDWTEITAGNTPYDRRGMASMGPFTLKPGDVEKVDFAFVTAPGDSSINVLDTLRTYIDSVRAYYFVDPDKFGYQYLGNDEIELVPQQHIKVYPNPATSAIFVRFANDNSNNDCRIYNIYGKEVMHFYLNGGNTKAIDVAGLKEGVYILKITSGSTVSSAKFIKR